MESMEYEKGIEQNFTEDGTTDLKGKRVLRSTTGRWRACYYMLGKCRNIFIYHKIYKIRFGYC
ncbi:putative proton-dependent oligopeptide transporter family [Helianthus anomalus]